MSHIQKGLRVLLALFLSIGFAVSAQASELDLVLPVLNAHQNQLLTWGLFICFAGILSGALAVYRMKKIPAHSSMLAISQTIFDTCKTYLIQQGRLLIVLEVFIAACIFFYFGYLQKVSAEGLTIILLSSVVGILGSYGVAWYGIRINNYANSRTAFAALTGKPFKVLTIPLKAGMSIGLMLISVELALMLGILLYVPREFAGAAFIGFAIGESLGASALRVCGGIFTKIADIGSDLMKIAFKIKEDDPRNPGTIADCAGDNAGDSVGPTADGFETYGVTGVALISFIVLGMFQYQAEMITWIFTMRILMVIVSVVAYYINKFFSYLLYGWRSHFDFEAPLTSLIWLTSLLSIAVTFIVSKWQLAGLPYDLWWKLSLIISCGTLGAALIPEFTKLFTSPKSKHVQETVTASDEGGASLNILSGLVAGNFSAFWKGMVFIALMAAAYFVSADIPQSVMIYPAIFAFGLVAFGFLGMGPVTIAVDSYGPVTDNAQSVFELSRIEEIKGIDKEIQRDFGFKPNFKKGKEYLEENDGAGNTFKATAKPVLIGTAVVGSTTMIFSLILIIEKQLGVKPELILNLLNPYTLFGFMAGGAVIYWFSGASIQAVTTGAYRAVQYIKKHMKLNSKSSASQNHSNEVVKICTEYAQAGMVNIFIVVFSFALSFAFFSAPVRGVESVSFFISYLISIALFGLFQAMFMANAGGCWDNTKKVVEVDLKQKNTPLHAATVVGDTVGDPFKDTTSVALNPIIKFTTLFGILAMEMAISPAVRGYAHLLGAVFLVIALIFVVRSFYGMRIPKV
jgi:K(+)-stimulated pyrophosphate-energized sodium pump